MGGLDMGQIFPVFNLTKCRCTVNICAIQTKEGIGGPSIVWTGKGGIQ